MKQITIVLLFWITFIPLSMAGDRQDVLAGRDNLYCIKLSNSFSLGISTSLKSLHNQENTWVSIALHSKDDTGAKKLYWQVEHFNMLHYHPETEDYYALVKVMEDKLFLFSTWNAHYCLIDKQTGRVLKRGSGDDMLREYDSLVPLKLKINTSATTEFLTGPAWVNFQKESLKTNRQSSAVIRREILTASKYDRFYVIQFRKPVSRREPMFVIAWKATTSGSSGFSFRKPVARIMIHDHWLKPLLKKKAVYLLQPDYSLQELDLTENEIADLFSHITNSEVRSDERVASIIKQRNFDGKESGWLKKLRAELEVFPPNSLWEQKVAPHLKVVDPAGVDIQGDLTTDQIPDQGDGKGGVTNIGKTNK